MDLLPLQVYNETVKQYRVHRFLMITQSLLQSLMPISLQPCAVLFVSSGAACPVVHAVLNCNAIALPKGTDAAN